MESPVTQFDVLIVHDGKTFGVQGLDYGVAAQGETFEKAIEAFRTRIRHQIILDKDLGIPLLSTLLPANQHFWDLFKKAIRIDKRIEIADENHVPMTWSREARFQDVTELASV